MYNNNKITIWAYQKNPYAVVENTCSYHCNNPIADMKLSSMSIIIILNIIGISIVSTSLILSLFLWYCLHFCVHI